MIPADHHIWRLSKGGDQALGVSCSEDGLYLGRTPIVERRSSGYAVRSQAELVRLFARAYGAGGATLQRVLPGLATVASALTQNNLPLAQIAALQLRLPDISDFALRSGLEEEDLLIKSGQAGVWDESDTRGPVRRPTPAGSLQSRALTRNPDPHIPRSAKEASGGANSFLIRWRRCGRPCGTPVS